MHNWKHLLSHSVQMQKDSTKFGRCTIVLRIHGEPERSGMHDIYNKCYYMRPSLQLRNIYDKCYATVEMSFQRNKLSLGHISSRALICYNRHNKLLLIVHYASAMLHDPDANIPVNTSIPFNFVELANFGRTWISLNSKWIEFLATNSKWIEFLPRCWRHRVWLKRELQAKWFKSATLSLWTGRA